MPIYEYRCPNGHEFEVFQSMAEDPISRCKECGAPVERVFHSVAVHFKGSGFYTTDYAHASDSDGTGSSETKKDSDKKGSDSKDSTKAKSDKSDTGGERAKARSNAD
jgi:putative FmdB family regulatory protein